MGVGEHEHGKRAQYEAVSQRGICDIVGLHTSGKGMGNASNLALCHALDNKQ